jgi:predicted component of type VI protein secretion system
VKAFAAAVTLVALSLVFAGCSSSRDANIRGAQGSLDGRRIVFDLDTCNANLSSTVEETEREVRILVTARNDTNGDCADVHEIVLSEPLGDRLLVDEADGEPVTVTLHEGIPDAP